MPFLFFLSKPTSQASLQHIQEYFTRQGEKNIGFTLVNTGEVQVKNATLFSTAEQLISLNEGQLLQYTSLKITHIIISSNINPQLSKENKYLDLLLEITALNNSASWNLQEAELWQNRAKLYLSFIALGKEVGQKEYYDIKQWYDQEYEVLPLWFKRLGHIVKVVTGKRTFKSLFSDNVKRTK